MKFCKVRLILVKKRNDVRDMYIYKYSFAHHLFPKLKKLILDCHLSILEKYKLYYIENI